VDLLWKGNLQRAVGRKLRAVRTDRGLTQEAFAEVLGRHRTYMGGLERGERNLTLKTVGRIADLLGLDPLDLLSDKQPTQRREPDDRPLASKGCAARITATYVRREWLRRKRWLIRFPTFR
jgi:transcriptional regulator with XRE-family HTH domain